MSRSMSRSTHREMKGDQALGYYRREHSARTPAAMSARPMTPGTVAVPKKKSEADPKNPRGIPTADYIVSVLPAGRPFAPPALS